MQRYEKNLTRASIYKKKWKKLHFSCIIQKKAVIVSAFSMVGHIVPARKGWLLTIKIVKTIATIPQRPRGGRVIKEDPHRINDKIRGVQQVRLIGDNVEQGIYSFQQAMKMADDQNLDLVEIAPTATPPVCRIIDYQKFLYAQKKKQKEAKANQKKQEVKEIRFGPQTDDHDYNFKLKHAIEFLKDGNKVKAYVFFRGRSIVFKEQGEILLARFAADLEEYGKAENVPNLEGKRMIMFISPKSNK